MIVERIVDGNNITLVNVYGPNRDTPDFCLKLRSKLLYSDASIVVCGDRNTVEDYDQDTRHIRRHHNPYAQHTMNAMMEEVELCDI